MNKLILKLTLILIIVIYFPNEVFSQKTNGFELEAGFNHSDLKDKLSYYIGGKYSYWFNPNLAYILGASVLHSKLDDKFDSPTNNNVVYYIDDNIVNFYCTTGFKAASPTLKGVGLMADLDFRFEPIPYNSISIDKNTFDPSTLNPKSESKNKYVFTHFNPSYNLQLSLFYDLKKDNRITRFSIGGGVGNYNAYNTYCQATVDNIKLRDHLILKPTSLTFSAFVRVSILGL